MKETEVAKPVIDWLAAEQWDVYQEVECYGGRADIVAVQNRRVWIIECKRSLSLAVIDQACNRRRCAHWVSIAVPRRKRRYVDPPWPSHIAGEVLRWKGIGLIKIMRDEWKDRFIVAPHFAPHLNRLAHLGAIELIGSLEPEHKTFAEAGTNGGGYWSPFRRTCRDALDEIKEHGPMSLKNLMKAITHHYANDSSARANFLVWIRDGKVPGLKVDEDSRPLRVILSEPDDRRIDTLCQMR